MYDPTKQQYRVERGKYTSIKASRGKRNDTVYFGYDPSSNLLSGIFLGDYELTSKIKNVSYSENEDYQFLTIDYVNNLGKIQSLTTSGLNKRYIPMIAEFFNSTLSIIDSSIMQLENDIQGLSTTISDVSNRLYANSLSINLRIQTLLLYHSTVDSSIDGLREYIDDVSSHLNLYQISNDSSIQDLSTRISDVTVGLSQVNNNVTNIENLLVWQVLD